MYIPSLLGSSVRFSSLPGGSFELLLFLHLAYLFRIQKGRKCNANFARYYERIELLLTSFVIFFYQNYIFPERQWMIRKILEAGKNSLDSPFLLCKHCFIKPREPFGVTSKSYLDNNTTLCGKSSTGLTQGKLI